jgi:hypothetical protein
MTVVGICFIAETDNLEEVINFIDNILKYIIVNTINYQIIFYIFSHVKYKIKKYDNIKVFYIPKVGNIMSNLLKFKYFIEKKESMKEVDEIYFINFNVNFSEKIYLTLENNKITTVNRRGYIFGGYIDTFFNFVHLLNKCVMYDLSYDINVNKYDYQINKYLMNIEKLNSIRTINANYDLRKNNTIATNYVTINLTGGIGNFLFQICATIIYAKNNMNNKYVFSTYKNNNSRPSICKYRLFDNLFKSEKNLDDIRVINENNYLTKSGEETNVKLIGLFHNLKYLKYGNDAPYDFKYFKSLLNFEDFTNVNNFYSQFEHVNTVSIHVRRTDYLKCKIYNNLLINYYKKAMNFFNNSIFFIFSDDINWCKSQEIFQNYDYSERHIIFIENFNDEESLYLMSKCKSNIIANSTFSLWGYYLNEYIGKQLIIPKKWYTDRDFDICTIIDDFTNVQIMDDLE